MKWGMAYGVDYANTLYSMVSRNTRRPLRFVCFTDDPTGLRREIEVAAPTADRPSSEAINGRHGEKSRCGSAISPASSGDVLFLDLDIVVTGSIDAFFDFEPQATYCVIENWTQAGEGIGNTSVFRLRVGAHAEVYDTLMADPGGDGREVPQQPDLRLAHDLQHDVLAGGMVPELQAHPGAALAAEFRQGRAAPGERRA